VSSLTEQERIGLEEVFLSISSQHRSLGKLHHFKQKLQQAWKATALVAGAKKPSKVLFQAHKRIKLPNFHHLLPKRNKKKKNLS
jgi:hypothetical protein